MPTNHIRNIFGEIQHEIARGVEMLETLHQNNNIASCASNGDISACATCHL